MKSIGNYLSDSANRKKLIMPGLPMLFLGILVILAIFAPLITPYNPTLSNLPEKFIPPLWEPGGSWQHVFGTDYFGRDMLTRLIYGGRVSLGVVSLSIVFSAAIGTLLGLISGYIGSAVDAIIMRLVDAMLSIPFLVIAIAVAAAIGASIQGTIIIIVAFQWPIYAKQVRAGTLSIKEQDFVLLAKVAGASQMRILYKHVLSNIMPVILVLATLHIGELILWEATLSFLGVGVPPPTPTWGTIISEGKDFITTRWWLSALPGIFIILTVVCANLVGDWVRDRLDPRLRQL